MYLNLKNVGAVKNASVNLTGLSVIAGKNGAGKSTISKTIYTIVKAIKEKDQIVKESIKEAAEMLCMRTFFTLQNDIKSRPIGSEPMSDERILRNFFDRDVFEHVLLECVYNGNFDRAQNLVGERIKVLEQLSDQVSDSSKNMVRGFLIALNEQLSQKGSKKDVHTALTYMYTKVFNRQINNLVSHDTSEVELEGFIKYHVSNNAGVVPFAERLVIDELKESRESTVFQNATLIESPLVLQLQKNRDLVNVPAYWSDLLDKIQRCLRSDSVLSEGLLKEVYKEIDELLGGRLTYDDEQQKVVFVKNDFETKSNLFVNNMSSGEKMLSIFQAFARVGLLGQEHLLILDEPENHLHPEWQVVLAQILTKLAAAGYPILVNSHSPDFIQALKIFADTDEDASKKTRFYLANSETGEIVDKTDKVSEILDELSEPINKVFKNLFAAKQ